MRNLLNELREQNVFVTLEKSDLKVKFNGSEAPTDLIKKIKNNKQQLVAYLENLNKHSADKAILVLPVQKSYSLSSAQRRLWILSQFKEASIAYNMPAALILEGDLNFSALSDSFKILIGRHEILRTLFKEDDNGEIKQFVCSSSSIEFKIFQEDLKNDEKQDQIIKDIVAAEAIKLFNLDSGLLLRANLYHLASQKWLFTYTMHHIVSDSWSMKILINEVLQTYNSIVTGQQSKLKPLTIQYKDYAGWQQAQLVGTGLKDSRAYWLKQFESEIPVLSLPSYEKRPHLKTFRGNTQSMDISINCVKEMVLLAQEQGSTMFMFLLSIVDVLLYRYTGQVDIIVGSPISGREHVDLEEQIGFYINVLPLRSRFNAKDTFLELLEKNKKITLEAYEHQSFPFDELIDELVLKRDQSRNALFDVLIDFRRNQIDSLSNDFQLENLKVSEYNFHQRVASKFDLTFYFTESEKGLNVLLEYNTDIYEHFMAESMLGHLESLISAVITTPLVPICQLDYLKKDEKDILINKFNQISPNYNHQRTVLSLIKENAERMPDRIALEFRGIKLTYKELNEKSNQLANYFIDFLSVQPNDLIGIMLDRSEYMIIAIIGILKSGAAFLPIDINYPQSRKEYIIKETGIKTLVTQTDYIFNLEFYDGHLFAADIQIDSLSNSINSPKIHSGFRDLSYVIYTSGSTGNPKGCAITHSNLSNYVQWANNFYFNNSNNTNFGLFTSLSFDFTITSIFCTLTLGGKLTIFTQQEDLANIFQYSFSTESAINTIKLTPSHLHILKLLKIKSSRISCAIVGGEPMTEEFVTILKQINPEIRIYNEYGPTETTVGCAATQLESNAPILIGKPIANTQIYILDELQMLCPIGVTGEIYVGGLGVGKGYLNQEELTAALFVNNHLTNSGRLYKTGDLGKWTREGNLVFLGRKDSQIKIRGNRVEVDEIEHLILEYPHIDSCIVVAKPNHESIDELAAYIISKKNVNESDLRIYLSQKLPSYMLPDHFRFLDSFPLTINGKIDVHKLPNPSSDRREVTDYVPPKNDIELKLVVIWQEVLGKSKVGVKDNFFDLGGNSLKIVKMAMLISKILDKKISVVDLFKLPNISLISEFLIGENVDGELNNTTEDINTSNNIMEKTLNLLQQNQYED